MTEAAQLQVDGLPTLTNLANRPLRNFDVGEVLGQDEIPGLFETYGSEGQIKVLSHPALVFLESIEQIQALPEYVQLIEMDRVSSVATLGTHELPEAERKTLASLLRMIGERHAASQKTPGGWLNKMRQRFGKPQGHVMNNAQDLIRHTIVDSFYKALGASENEALGTEEWGSVREKSRLWRSRREFVELKWPGQAIESQVDNITQVASARAGERLGPNLPFLITELVKSNTEYVGALAQYTAYLAEFNTPDFDVNRDKARNRQGDMLSHVLREHLPVEERMESLPEVVILRGVGQTREHWQSRMKAYNAQDIKCRFVDFGDFSSGMTIEQQSEQLARQLKEGWNGEAFGLECHSWGGLVAWHLAHKYPELVSHMIITGAPTRSDKKGDPYLKALPLVHGLQWALNNPELAWNHVIQRIGFFKSLGKDGWPQAFRVYLDHIGKDGRSQWDRIIPKTSWTIPSLLLYGKKDNIVYNLAGFRAAYLAPGGRLLVNPNGDHDVIGDHDTALYAHEALYTEAKRRRLARVD